MIMIMIMIMIIIIIIIVIIMSALHCQTQVWFFINSSKTSFNWLLWQHRMLLITRKYSPYMHDKIIHGTLGFHNLFQILYRYLRNLWPPLVLSLTFFIQDLLGGKPYMQSVFWGIFFTPTSSSKFGWSVHCLKNLENWNWDLQWGFNKIAIELVNKWKRLTGPICPSLFLTLSLLDSPKPVPLLFYSV